MSSSGLFLSGDEEAALLDTIAALPLQAARYKDYTARRRVASFGGQYDYRCNELLPAPPIPDALLPLRAKVAAWLGIDTDAFAHALVAEYAPGTPAPRSAYVLRGEARWGWQHSLAPTDALRYSTTLRTRRGASLTR